VLSALQTPTPVKALLPVKHKSGTVPLLRASFIVLFNDTFQTQINRSKADDMPRDQPEEKHEARSEQLTVTEFGKAISGKAPSRNIPSRQLLHVTMLAAVAYY
jgi:hypothetical protein